MRSMIAAVPRPASTNLRPVKKANSFASRPKYQPIRKSRDKVRIEAATVPQK